MVQCIDRTIRGKDQLAREPLDAHNAHLAIIAKQSMLQVKFATRFILQTSLQHDLSCAPHCNIIRCRKNHRQVLFATRPMLQRTFSKAPV